ncbi:MAG: ATP-binding protein [Myxococcota bacterium]|jgi:DNA polymerase III delta prime subunit|nr:ATP-binding protein [Myxococcota bacterium]
MDEQIAKSGGYASPEDEFQDWITLTLLHIHRCLAELQERGVLPVDPDGWHSDRIDLAEVEGHLAAFRHEPLSDQVPALDGTRQTIAAWKLAIQTRSRLAREAGQVLPLHQLQLSCGLEQDEVLLVVATLLDEVFGHVDRLFRFIQDDFNLEPMTPFLAQRLLAPATTAGLARCRRWLQDGPLFRLGVLRWRDPARHPRENPLYHRFGLEPQVREFLLRPHPGHEVQAPREQRSLASAEWLGPIQRQVKAWMSEPASSSWKILQLVGRSGRGAELFLRELLTEQGRRLRGWTTPEASSADPPLAELLRTELLLARLDGAVPCWSSCQRQSARFAELPQLLAGLPVGPNPLLLLLGDTPLPLKPLDDVEVVQLPMPLPPKRVRTMLWQAGLPADLPPEPAIDLDLFASAYELGPEEIQEAAAFAALRARRRGTDQGLLQEDLREGCRHVLGQGLTRLATLVEPRHTLEDLVVPEHTLERIEELIAQVRHRDQVLDRWRVGQKLKPRRGVSALFFGPPGTGKSLAASIIAGQLGLLLYRIDLSRIVDKYIGETEKHLEEIFGLAEEGHAVLLFDEADAVFAKRTAVHGSVDRYSNMEVNYLLQRMESYDGMVILTTNLPDQLDPAFRRRIDFKIEFPFPDEQERLDLWCVLWPPEVPRQEELPFEELAEDFEIAGGSIRNAIVRACFLAAATGRSMDGELLRRATELEAEESGRLIARE